MANTKLIATAFLCVAIVGLFARRTLRGDINPYGPRVVQHHEEVDITEFLPGATDDSETYFVFLQKFPLQHSFKMIFHTEVVVCPSTAFEDDAVFRNTLNSLLNTVAPSRFDGDGVQESTKESLFAPVPKEQWAKQSKPECVQLGYGGSSCSTGCCGSPQRDKNRGYALNSQGSVIGNAMGAEKELFVYGTSRSISGGDAYRAVCHGHLGAVETGTLPKCVSDWKGTDYGPIMNNCNTFTSTVLKCVYGLSDAKPHLGVSDLINVKCPAENTVDGKPVEQCSIPSRAEAETFSFESVEEAME